MTLTSKKGAFKNNLKIQTGEEIPLGKSMKSPLSATEIPSLEKISIKEKPPLSAETDVNSAYKFGPACIMPNLFLGSSQNASNPDILISLGNSNRTHVLNVAEEVFNPLAEDATAHSKTSFQTSKNSLWKITSTKNNPKSPVKCGSSSPILEITSQNFPAQENLRRKLSTPSVLLSSTTESNSTPLTIPIQKSDVIVVQIKNEHILHYKKLAWSHNEEIEDHLETAFQFIDEARSKGLPVLINCQQGVSRSASLVIAYVMKSLKLSANEAYAFVKTKSPLISPNVGFIAQLVEFEEFMKNNSD